MRRTKAWNVCRYHKEFFKPCRFLALSRKWVAKSPYKRILQTYLGFHVIPEIQGVGFPFTQEPTIFTDSMLPLCLSSPWNQCEAGSTSLKRRTKNKRKSWTTENPMISWGLSEKWSFKQIMTKNSEKQANLDLHMQNWNNRRWWERMEQKKYFK